MKRTFTTIVCALLLVAMLAGCGSTGSTNPFDAKAKTFDAEGMQITLTTDFSQESLEGTPLATLRKRRSCSPSMRRRRSLPKPAWKT